MNVTVWVEGELTTTTSLEQLVKNYRPGNTAQEIARFIEDDGEYNFHADNIGNVDVYEA